MPVHRVPVDDQFEKTVDRIQQRETIISTLLHGNGCVLVFTEKGRKGRETRG